MWRRSLKTGGLGQTQTLIYFISLSKAYPQIYKNVLGRNVPGKKAKSKQEGQSDPATGAHPVNERMKQTHMRCRANLEIQPSFPETRRGVTKAKECWMQN